MPDNKIIQAFLMEETMDTSKPTVQGLLGFYNNVLHSVSLNTNEEGLISMSILGDNTPVVVTDKRLVLPTEPILRNGNWVNHIAFHPMSENIYRGESAVLKKLRNLVNLRLISVIHSLITQLTDIAIDTDSHSKLSPKQSGLLSILPKVDNTTRDTFSKILDQTSPITDRRVANIYLKRGGKLKGKDFSRIGVVSFPITEEFDNEDKSIYGVKLRVKDFKSFQDLFDYLVPEAGDLETYSYGSNSAVAPYFHALMKAFINVAKQLNKTTKLFKKFLDDADELMIDVDWEEEIDNLSFYRDLIPSLEGNDGELSMDEKKAAEIPPWEDQNAKSNPVPAFNVNQSPPIPAPVQQPQMSKASPSTGGLSWQDILNKRTNGQANMVPTAPMGFAGQPAPAQPPQQIWPPAGGQGGGWNQQNTGFFPQSNTYSSGI